MASIWTMGELLVEIMRPQAGMGLREPDAFLGPYPSGAPAIFIDTVARLGHPAGMIGGVGEDDFGRCVVERLRAHAPHAKLLLARSVTHDRAEIIRQIDALAESCCQYAETDLLHQLRELVPEFVEEPGSEKVLRAD